MGSFEVLISTCAQFVRRAYLLFLFVFDLSLSVPHVPRVLQTSSPSPVLKARSRSSVQLSLCTCAQDLKEDQLRAQISAVRSSLERSTGLLLACSKVRLPECACVSACLLTPPLVSTLVGVLVGVLVSRFVRISRFSPRCAPPLPLPLRPLDLPH